MKKFNINVTTGWCGMDQDYSAYAENESDLENIAQRLSYDNFCDFDCMEQILQDNFEVDEDTGEFSDEDREEAALMENEYFGYDITEVLENSDEEEYFDDYELVYDARLKNLSYLEQINIYNTFLINFHTAMWTGRDLQPFFKKMEEYSYTRTNSCEGESDRSREISYINTLINLTK